MELDKAEAPEAELVAVDPNSSCSWWADARSLSLHLLTTLLGALSLVVGLAHPLYSRLSVLAVLSVVQVVVAIFCCVASAAALCGHEVWRRLPCCLGLGLAAAALISCGAALCAVVISACTYAERAQPDDYYAWTDEAGLSWRHPKHTDLFLPPLMASSLCCTGSARTAAAATARPRGPECRELRMPLEALGRRLLLLPQRPAAAVGRRHARRRRHAEPAARCGARPAATPADAPASPTVAAAS